MKQLPIRLCAFSMGCVVAGSQAERPGQIPVKILGQFLDPGLQLLSLYSILMVLKYTRTREYFVSKTQVWKYAYAMLMLMLITNKPGFCYCVKISNSWSTIYASKSEIKTSCRYEEICGFASQPNPDKNEGALTVNFGGFGGAGGDANYLIVRRSVFPTNLNLK